MRTTMDAAGRIVIPKAIRDNAGFLPGVPLDISVHDGKVEIEAACITMHLEQRGHFWVAVPDEPLPQVSVSAEQYERWREAIMLERERQILGVE